MLKKTMGFVLGILALANGVSVAAPDAPRRGGVLIAMAREDLPQGFALNETSTVSGIWPVMPCYSNLVLFDPRKPVESLDTVIGELAERWSWQGSYRNLVFFLRKGVVWHDGQPFTSRDVKYTYDLIRGAKEATARLRIAPRKDWFANVESIETPDSHTVVFRLKRPQPSLLLMLASGDTTVYPAHIPPAELRTRCVGTGPFKLKEWRRGEFFEYVRNPDYFIKDRPFLDGIKFIVIADRSTRYAALRAGRLDIASPGETTKAIADELKAVAPLLVITPVATSVYYNVLLNHTKPPFDNVKLRQAVNRAIDRRAYVRAVLHGGGVVGVSMAPPPFGVWGLIGKDLERFPGYGDPTKEQAEARKLLAEAGYGPANPLRVEMVTRAIAVYMDFASFVVDELRKVGINASLRQIETAQWDGALARKEFLMGANLTGVGVDDPDVNFYENYTCTSPRNHTGYCNQEVISLIDRQSQELDPRKRRALVADIQRKLEEDAARPVMGWGLDFFAQWPYVKGLVPHNNIYNYGRLQEVWLDR